MMSSFLARIYENIKMAAASNAANPRKTLAEILNVEPELLREKFHLEPFHSYDPHEKDNLAFLSPIVCLKDLELREGLRRRMEGQRSEGRIRPSGERYFKVKRLFPFSSAGDNFLSYGVWKNVRT